jgi:hypothetical protein
MTTPRRVGGYADTDLLDRALRLNEDLADQLGEIADSLAQQPRLAARAVRMAGLLARQHGHLVEMRSIRRSANKALPDPQ